MEVPLIITFTPGSEPPSSDCIVPEIVIDVCDQAAEPAMTKPVKKRVSKNLPGYIGLSDKYALCKDGLENGLTFSVEK